MLLDFTACFDTVDRDILFDNLYRCRVIGVASDFIESYCLNRQQRIHTDKNISAVQEQNLGTYQESKCGPPIFDIYSNDLNNNCSFHENILFPDDTSLIHVHEDLC